MRKYFFPVFTGLIFLGHLLSAEESLFVIPLKPDPPFTIDGDLSDWQDVPNELHLDDQKQVTWGSVSWADPSDLSAKARLAWREGVIYLAVEVADNVLYAKESGMAMYKGDHVSLYLDFNPAHEPERSSLGPGQWQFGFKPEIREAKASLEAFCFKPEGYGVKGIQVASTRTTTGYTIEAAIPLSVVEVKNIYQNMNIKAELFVSDCDSVNPKQEKLMTISTSPWTPTRQRLVPMIFGDAKGQGSAPAESITISDDREIARQMQEKIYFESPVKASDKEVYVFLRARIHRPKVGGWCSALRLSLNGKQLDGQRFSNRPLVSKSSDGRASTYVKSTGEASVFFAPDFTAPDLDQNYRLIDGAKACEFEYRITDLLIADKNELILQNLGHSDPKIDSTLIVADLSLKIKRPPGFPFTLNIPVTI